MRGCSAVAALLSLPLAWSLVSPAHDTVADEPSQHTPVDASAAPPPFESSNPSSASWLPDGAVTTSALFYTTFTLPEQQATVTSVPPTHTIEASSPFVTQLPAAGETFNSYDNSPPPHFDLNDDGAQKPLGRASKVWRATLTKLSCLSGLLCRNRDRTPVQIPIGSPQLNTDHDGHDELDGNDFMPTTNPAPSFHSQIHPTSATGSIAMVATSIPTIASMATGSSESSPILTLLSNRKYILAFLFSVLATLTISFSICLFIVRWNPRRRAERLAMWEEYRNKRIFAKAAFKHRFNNWGSMTFGRLWFIGQRTQSTAVVEAGYDKELAVDSNYPSDIESDGGERLIREVRSFRNVHDRVDALLRAEQGLSIASLRAKEKQQHPADRNRWRTYKWLFGGGSKRHEKRRRKNLAQRPRSGSAGSSSMSGGTDIESLPSDSEKSARTAGTAPPPYDENEKYQIVDDRFLLKVVTQGTVAAAAAAQDRSDCSSLSSVIPTSPKEGSFRTSGSTDGDDIL